MEKVFGESRQKQKQEQDDDIDNLVDEATVKTFSTLAMSNLIKETSCNNRQLRALNDLFSNDSSSSSTTKVASIENP